MPAVAIVETPAEQANRTARAGEINGDAVDRFTFVHASAGAAAQRAGVSLGLTIIGAVAFEFAEREMKRRWPEKFPNPTQDSLANATCDVLASVAGWYASRALARRRRS